MKGELAERLEPKLHQNIAFQEVENGIFASSLEQRVWELYPRNKQNPDDYQAQEEWGGVPR